MARKKELGDLTAEERQPLEQIGPKGKRSARQLTRAPILLKADEGLVTARQLITGFRKMSGDGFRNSNPRETCCV